MKTAVQQVFSELEELHPNLFNINTTEGKQFVHHFHKYIAMEKEQIINANNRGFKVARESIYELGEQYYNETYNKSINNKG
jgi:gamma-glutamyl phosphate reductase